MNYVNQLLSGLNGFDAENCRSAAATRRAKARCQTRAMWTWAFGTARANVTRISRLAGNRRVGSCPEYFFFWPQPPPRQAVRTRRPPLLPLPISATSSPAGWMPQTAAPPERATRIASRSARRKGRASGCESPARTPALRGGFFHLQFLRSLPVFVGQIFEPGARDPGERFIGAHLGEQTDMFIA